MGIKDFLKTVLGNGKLVSDYGEEMPRDFINGKKIAVDAFNVIYKNMYVLKEHLTHEGRVTTHIKITLQKIRMLRARGVQQLWVFDDHYNNPLKIETQQKRTLKLSRDHVAEIKKLLSLCGIKWIAVKTEAEFYAAELSRGPFDYVLSTDADVIIRGGKLLKETRDGYTVFDGQAIMDDLKISQETFAKIGVMLGCDFAPKTPRVGPKSVWKKLHLELTPRQEEAVEFLTHKIDLRGVISASPKTEEEDTERLNEWLRELGFKI